jgi:hypothetical protein
LQIIFIFFLDINACIFPFPFVFTNNFSSSESDKLKLNKANKEIETFKTNKIGTKVIPIKEYDSAEICKQYIFNDNRKKAGIYL